MRGLAFPTNTVVDREASYEYGTPISNVDEIPIDPALSGAPIDPALMVEDSITNFVQTQQEIRDVQQQEAPPEDYQMRQYSQGPQGDPFAPQLPPPFFPIKQQQLLPTPKPKRKRRICREEECSFCQGNDTRNTMGDPELMLTCHLCGRSGHPSCMHLAKQAEVMRSYEWKCIECKNCELCKEKGDDERILFCDGCDRGWHLDCMVPPLETPPEGAWHCPACPDIIPEGQESTNSAHQPEEIKSQSPFFTAKRETSIASTSRSVMQVRAPTRGRGRKRGVGRGRGGVPRVAVASENSDGEEVEALALSRARGRMKSNAKGKARSATPSSDEELTVSPIRPLKRKRTQLSLPRVHLRLPPRGKGKGREEEETSHGLFDDILGSAERDTSKTSITNIDKTYFERSRLSAEDKLAPPPTATSSRTLDATEFSSPMHRPLRSASLHHVPSRIDLSNSPAPSTPGGPLPKLELGVLRIRSIRFGQYDIKTWYDAPFPEEYASIPDGRLWICEFCLKYMKSRFGAFRHRMKCHARNPPGDEIYRDGAISIFEVDGRRNKIYCQNLCLLSKMFLDHKSLFYDVEPFLFYVITETDEFGARFVGYFSKEKRCPKEYNLSCIMTLPVRQRQGWGNLLVDFSYLLSKIEQRLGSPEKPLSSLGALSYKNYWTLAIMRFLRSTPENVPIRLQDISTGTSMTIEDVFNTLTQLNMIFISEASPPPIRPSPGQTIKFPKGRKNGIARKHLQRMQTQDKELDGVKAPFVIPKNYEIRFDRTKVEEYLSNWESKGYLKLKPEKLQWTPYIMTRNPKENGGTPLTNFASRQSHPSDDTIVMAEVHVHMEKGSNNFADFRGAVHAESDLRSTLGPDELLDEDADGEYDEDAEGEADEVGYYCANHPGQFQPNPFRKLSSVARFLYGLAGTKVSVHPLERLSFSENTDHAAPAPIDSEAAMQYAHMGLQDRRDQNLDGSGSTNFHQNGGLGQALGGGHINPGAAYTRTTEYRNPSTSPPTLTQAGTSHAGPSSNHSPLTFAVAGQSPAMKRKQVDGSMNNQTQKRRRETAGAGDEGDSYDMDGNAQGAKHWTDEEKSKLFTWLMGAGQEEHWNSLRATKNSCLRECATEVFGGKKTYQALKGCYERNFNLFKQIYAFETAHGQAGGNTNLAGLSEADRLREYERRLQIARKAGSDVGNITARTIDHWHRVGWYDLFYRRWHGDPATTRPIQGRTTGVGVSNNMNGGQVGADEPDDDGPMLDFSDPSTMNNLNGMSHDRQHVFINPQNLPNDIPNPIPNPISNPGLRTPGQMPPPPAPELPVINLPITQDMVARGLHLIHLQTQVAQEKLEYLRRREAREISEFAQRKDAVDKANMTRHKFERAIDLLSSAHADPSLKHVTTEYLTNLTKLLLGQD